MLEDLCNSIYDNAANGVADVGCLVWCPVPHLEEIPRILDVERAKSEDHYATKFQITQLSKDHFKSKAKLPIKALALGDTEELLISKAKKRPCLIVASRNTTYDDVRIQEELRRRRHLQDQSMILAPIYGIASPDNKTGFPPVMVARIKALLYDQFFYLPRACHKTGLSLVKDGIIRLDRLFAASLKRGISPMKIRLAADPLALLLAILQTRFGGHASEHLIVARQLLNETLPDECRPHH